MSPADDPVLIDLHTLVPDPPAHLLGWAGLEGRLRRRRRQRLGTAVAMLLIAAAVAATGPMWWPLPAARRTLTGLPAGPTPCAGQPPGCGQGAGTPSRLARGRWLALPAGPLSPRSDYGQAWTGTQLVIWGGDYAGSGSSRNPQALADGARFYPATNSWRVMAPAPLSARADPATVWTGARVLFWGGQRLVPSGSEFFADGAAYDPAANTWQQLAPAPLSARAQPYAVWTGSRMIVFGGSTSPNQSQAVDGASYDPATNSWVKLPTFPARSKGNLVGTVAVWTGRRLLVWATYERRRDTPNGFSIFGEQVAAAWTPGASGWQILPTPPPDQFTYGATAVWTGSTVLLAHGGFCLPDMSCPAVIEGKVTSYDPASNTWTNSPLTAVAATAGPSVWTGQSLVLINADAKAGGALALTPGDGVAIGPHLAGWSVLPPSPVANLAGASAVWTGAELLVWDGFSGSGPPAAEALRPAGAPTRQASTSTEPACTPNEYSISYQGPEHAGAQLFVNAIFRLRKGSGCRITGQLAMSLTVGGHLLPSVGNNPLVQAAGVNLDLAHPVRVLSLGWGNWCGPTTGPFTLVISFDGHSHALPATNAPPACLNSAQPSRLSPG